MAIDFVPNAANTNIHIIGKAGPTGPTTTVGVPFPKSQPNLVGWYRFNVGITTSGSDVVGWADSSGQNHNLSLSSGFTFINPQVSASGVFFPQSTTGVNSTYVNCLRAAFTLSLPVTVYLKVKLPIITPNGGVGLFSGGDSAFYSDRYGGFAQLNSPTDWSLVTFDSTFDPQNSGYNIGGTTIMVAFVLNGASTLFELSGNSPVNAGTTPTFHPPNGFSIGAFNSYDNANAGQAQTIKEAICYNAAHNQATRTAMFNYLAGV